MTKKKLYTLTDEHRAQLKPWAEKWIANAMSTKPMDDTDREAVRVAVAGLYSAADLKQPNNVVFAGGPVTASVAAGIAAGVWYLRDHDMRKQLGAYNESTLFTAIPLACAAVFGGRPVKRVDAATDAATRAATRDATDAATAASTYNATYNAASAATAAATYNATYAATDAATRDTTYAATDAATRDTNRLTAFLVECAERGINLRQGGNHWSAWDSFLTFFRHVVKLPLDYSKYDHWEKATIHAGPRFIHARFCIVSDRPRVLKVDEQNRPHCATGPSHRWVDGIELHYWHGVRVPREWIEAPNTVDPRLALTHTQIEERTALAQILGWDRVLAQLSPRVIDTDEPHIGELLEVDLPDAPGSRFLRVRGPGAHGPNGAYVLGVPREMKTAKDANAWTYGFSNFQSGERT